MMPKYPSPEEMEHAVDIYTIWQDLPRTVQYAVISSLMDAYCERYHMHYQTLTDMYINDRRNIDATFIEL